MQRIKRIAQFSYPYVRPYFRYLIIGVLCGVFFGISNGAIVWLTKTLLTRMDPTTYAQAQAPRAAESNDISTADIEPPGFWNATKASLQRTKAQLGDQIQVFVDPWIPVAGRALDLRQIIGVAVLLPLFGVSRSFAGYFSTYCLAWLGERVINDLRMKVFGNLIGLSLDYFNRATLGDMITRINGDTRMLQRTLGHGVEHVVKDPMTLLSVLIMLLILDPMLTIVTLLILPAMLSPVAYFARKSKKASKKTVETNVVQSSLTIEMLSGIRVVKAFNLESQQTTRFNDLSKYLFRQTMKRIRSTELVSPVIESISLVVVVGLILFVFQTQRSVPDIMAFFLGLLLFYTPVKKLARLHVLFENTSVGVDRLQDVLAEKATVIESAAPKPWPSFQNQIEFKNVSFSYGAETVLSDFSISIPRGSKLGIAGESGSGKSTIVNLLFRFFDPNQGAIAIDGIDVREMATADLRRHMALVSQDVVVFDQTVSENIACGRPGCTHAEVEAAARAAYAHEFITNLPDGYDTRVGERGVTLSGGQRQRLSIARAFVRNAPILVLDEATAALDSRSEAEVQRAIDHLTENRTVLCIAHRLATLQTMDEIIALSEGRIVERGSFAQLLDGQGIFADMAARQGIRIQTGEQP